MARTPMHTARSKPARAHGSRRAARKSWAVELPTSAAGRRLITLSIAAIAVASLVIACGPERMGGPTITVENDTGRAVLLERLDDKWTIPSGFDGYVTRLEMTAFQGGATFRVRD